MSQKSLGLRGDGFIGFDVVVDVAEALETIAGMAVRTADLAPVLSGPVNVAVNEMLVEQFATEGQGRWAPLAPATLALRQRRGHGFGGILRDRDALWASLTKLGLGPDAVKTVTADTLRRGTTVPYAGPHQTGFASATFGVLDRNGNVTGVYRATPRDVPARPVIPDPVPEQHVERWTGLLATFILQGA